MDARPIETLDSPLAAAVRATPSKSVTHRALVSAALADGESTLRGPLEAEDTRITRDALCALGVQIRSFDDRWVVRGSGGRLTGGAELRLRESGTSMRFLLAVAALGTKPSTLDGSPRLRERPVQELAAAIEGLGGRVELAQSAGGLPALVGGRAMRGGVVRLPAQRSSQFASALMLIAPRLQQGVELDLVPPAVSLPYVELTASVMREFGARVESAGRLSWRVPPAGTTGRDYRIEGDHSSASYFLAAAAVVGGRVRIDGLSRRSLQPDSRLGELLHELGCEVIDGESWVEVEGTGIIPPFETNLLDAPDLAPTVAVLALFAQGPCAIAGLAHLRHKESDRLELLARNARALGRDVRVEGDRLLFGDPTLLRGATVETASDHRMAMAFAVAGLRLEGVIVDDAGCVGKSNPAFWSQLERLAAGR